MQTPYEERKDDSSPLYFSLFKMFDKIGVAKATKWRSLFLYFREMKDYTHLSDAQKTQIQLLMTETLEKRDYTENNLKTVLNEYLRIVVSPYKKKIDELLREASGIIQSFQGLLSKRYGDISCLEEATIACIETETDEQIVVQKLRGAFNGIKVLLENDMRSLECLASKDPLTSIANRRAFDSFMDAAVVKWCDEGQNIALALFDIDFFKRFNDEHGHRIGDQVLVVVAKQLTSCIRASVGDTSSVLAARYGGEEFAIAAVGPAAQMLPQLAEKIRLAIKNFNLLIRDSHGNVVESGLHITVSAGVTSAWSGWCGAYAENLVDCADKALYHAKQTGRDRVVLFDPEGRECYVPLTLHKA